MSDRLAGGITFHKNTKSSKRTLHLTTILLLLLGVTISSLWGLSSAFAADPIGLPNHLIINQVYGSGPLDDSGAVSHSFIELYNPTDAAVSLGGWSLQLQNGNASGVEATEWEKLDFPAGASVEAQGYYLVRLAEAAPNARMVINKADVDWADGRIMSNRSYSVALVSNTSLLTQTITAEEMAGVVDLVGALNTAPADAPLNYEATPVDGMSKQKPIRRIDFIDTNDNKADFEVLDYRAAGLSDSQLQQKGPHYSGGLAFGDGTPPAVGSLPNHLIINQAAGVGASADGAIQYSFVEIYNPTDADVDVSGWSLQYAESGDSWAMLNLEGSIPAKCSYLVRMNGGNDIAGTTRLYLPVADLEWSMVISNNAFKFALVDGQSLLTTYNPTAADGVVDLVGANNPPAAIDFWEGAGPVAKMSKQQSVRRIGFADYDQNWYDFQNVDFRTANTDTYSPRSLADGPWGTDIVVPVGPVLSAGTIGFSKPSGVYADEFDLSLEPSDTNYTIRYTLDGNDPTSTSPAYTAPLRMYDRTNDPEVLAWETGTTGPRNEMPTYDRSAIQPVFKGTVVKAQLFKDDGTPASDIYVNSYFVNADIASLYGDLPIVSVSTPPDNFFDDNTGIYVKGPNDNGPFNFDQKGSEWERSIYFEMFDPAIGDGWETNAVVSQGMGVRIHGGASRQFPQKSLRLYARSGSLNTNMGVEPVINGKNAIDYDLFNGKAVDAYGNPLTGGFTRIMLRAAGNDAASSFLRDPISNLLASGTDTLENQSYRPVVVFLNGEFWGLYQMEERYDEDYLAQHYGGSSSNYSILENPSPGNTSLEDNAAADIDYYESVVADISAIGDMNTADAYNEVLKYIDEDSLIDYVILETLGGNLDWVGFDGEWDTPYGHFVYHGNNQRMWRYTGTPTDQLAQDGKYRWMVYDTDKTWGYHSGGEYSDPAYNTVQDALSDNLFFFNMLWQNDAFRAKFLGRYMDALDSWLSLDVMQQTVDSAAAEIENAIVEQQKRWPYSLTYDEWTAEIGYIKDWMALRTDPDGAFITSLKAFAAVQGETVSVAAYVGEPDSLPPGIDWDDVGVFMDAQAYDTVEMTGTVTGTSIPVTVTVEVVPRDLLYFIDSGTAQSGSLAFDSVASLLSQDGKALLNDASDQAYDGSWGLTESQFPVVYQGYLDQKLADGYVGWDLRPTDPAYDGKNAYVEYKVWLPAGSYDITTGHFCWWDPMLDDQGVVYGGFPRSMEVQFLDEAGDLMFAGRPFTFSNLGDNKTLTYRYVQAEDGVLTIRVATTEGDGAVLSYIGIASAGPDRITELLGESHLDAAAYVGETEGVLPSTTEVYYLSGITASVDVEWDLAPLAAASAYDTVELTGTVAGSKFTITATVEVIPRNLVYYIDAGTARLYRDDSSPVYPSTSSWDANGDAAYGSSDSFLVSTAYPSVVAKLAQDGGMLANDESDQLFDGVWGLMPDAYQFPVVHLNPEPGIGQKLASGYVGWDDRADDAYLDKNKYIEYQLYLPAGVYQITTGHYCWWDPMYDDQGTVSGGFPRTMEVLFNDEAPEGATSFTFDRLGDNKVVTYTYTQIADGLMDIKVPALNGTDGSTLSFVGVASTGQDYIVGLTGSSDIRAAVYEDAKDCLPSTLEVVYGSGKTDMAEVDWDFTPLANAQAYDTAEVTGTVVGTRITVTATVEVVPRNLVYFIDCGTASSNDLSLDQFNGGVLYAASAYENPSYGGPALGGSLAYDSVAGLLAADAQALLNGASDQVYDGAWGATDYQFPVANLDYL
ncbi:MAG: CotH kinase family protein, partial [Eggerthellaceae bacterium]|nr:CotH kinase family protein [Eggerthellaceae bacterium]